MLDNQYELNKGLAQMLKGGVIMDVTTPEQAKIAEEAGACAVMALERIPADIRAAGDISRIGHFVEAQILEAIEIDYIDESEVLSPADDVYHIAERKLRKGRYSNPDVCGLGYNWMLGGQKFQEASL